MRVVPVVLEKIHKSTDMLGDTITHEMEQGKIGEDHLMDWSVSMQQGRRSTALFGELDML